MATHVLNRLVATVVAAGACCMAMAVAIAVRTPTPAWWQLAVVVVLVAASSLTRFDLRIGSNVMRLCWGEAAVLAGFVLVGPVWVVLIVPLGAVISESVQHVPPQKILFNAASDVVAAAVAGVVLHYAAAGATFGSGQRILGLIAAAAAFTVISHAAVSSAVGLSQGLQVITVFMDGASLILVNLGANVVVGFFIAAIARIDLRLLAALPVLLWMVHETFAGRVRARAERRAWRRLADTTSRLTALEPGGVVETALCGASRLFSADMVEIVVTGDGAPLIFRGDFGGLLPADVAHSAARDDYEIVIVRELGDGIERLGELRLCFHGAVSLDEREELALSTFTSALATALRNAQAHEQLQDLATRKAYEAAHDSLTGLANRSGLYDAALKLYDGGTPATAAVAMLLLDLDHFKEVNDTLGHGAGDNVLVEASRRLRDTVRSGEILARLGGDEFAVLIVVDDATHADTHGLVRAHALRDALAATPIRTDGVAVTLEASVGVAVVGVTDLDLVELLRQADVAMYQAKNTPVHVGLYEADRDAASLDRLALAGELRAALDGTDQLIVYLQPVVNLHTGEPLGAEVLARWNHPRRGLLQPGDFIDTVEQSDLAGPFTRRVLDLALRERDSWTRSGLPPLPVSVNLPVRLLLDRDFPATVAALLQRHGVDPGDLVLEITERVMLSELETVDVVLAELRDIGVQLSVDDFGTGCSSLSLLTRLPVTEVKIDRSFVDGMAHSRGNEAVVRTVVELGRMLGLRVVAEGIETDEQRRALAALGCTAGQGYLFCPPVGPAKARSMMWAFAERAERSEHTAEIIPMGTARRPVSVIPERHTS